MPLTGWPAAGTLSPWASAHGASDVEGQDPDEDTPHAVLSPHEIFAARVQVAMFYDARRSGAWLLLGIIAFATLLTTHWFVLLLPAALGFALWGFYRSEARMRMRFIRTLQP